jgi:hypothetical protein
MSNQEYNFQKDLEDAIFNSDSSKINRHELLIDIFKNYVAKLFEYILSKKEKNRIELDAMIQIKRNLINEFTKASLGEYQKTDDQYDELFEQTIKEIFNDAALNHEGENIVSVNQNLEINKTIYTNEHGLFVPFHGNTPTYIN